MNGVLAQFFHVLFSHFYLPLYRSPIKQNNFSISTLTNSCVDVNHNDKYTKT